MKKQEIVFIDKHIIENSLESEFKDFEDGVQCLCAKSVEADLITSNKKDFIHSEIKVLILMKSVLSAEVEFKFYFCVLENGYIIKVCDRCIELKLDEVVYYNFSIDEYNL